MPIKTRLCISDHGKAGVIGIFLAESSHSQPRKAMKDTPAITKKLITRPELHAYLELPSCRAEMTKEHEVKIKAAPIPSRRDRDLTPPQTDFELTDSDFASGK